MTSEPSPVARLLTNFNTASPGTCDVPLCSFLNQADMISYSLVCKNALRAVRSYNAIAYRLCHSLAKFMSENEVLAFRETMRQTGTLISGSVAIHYFARTPVGDSDLDLYTEGRHARQLFDFILGLGYTYRPRRSQEIDLDSSLIRARNLFAVRDDAIYDQRAILDAFSFVRGDAIIQVMIAVESAIDTILDFHSTPVMNFISFRSAYSLFPGNTFMKNAGIRFIDEYDDNPIEKYTARGWRFTGTTHINTLARMGEEICAPVRFVGDRYTWIIDLDDSASFVVDPVLFNSWELTWTYRASELIHPEIRRFSYIGPNAWSQSRVFANDQLLSRFTDITTGLGDGDSDHDALTMVLKSAACTLFHREPPSATDVGFYRRWIQTRAARRLVVSKDVDRLAREDGCVTAPCPNVEAPAADTGSNADPAVATQYTSNIPGYSGSARLLPVDCEETSDEDDAPPRKKARTVL
ncbi:hypothetical protein EV715DRAFT_297672 [Schizophyllum commune]